ncbi:MAG: phytanoyl-CoA dioxygenase family protein [Acidimicrobiia bacterium]|nr:phytanoyl-CoA dioxygenase family protein [Acidimicrobiia bacterium]
MVGPLTEQQVDDFRRDGHMLVRGLIGRDQALELAEPILRLLRENPYDKRPWHERGPYDRVYDISGDTYLFDERCRRVTFSDRIARMAAQLLGTNGVRLFFDEAVNKPAPGAPTPWHRDGVFWGIDQRHLGLPWGMDCIRIWIALADLPPEVGGMAFVSGSHRVEGQHFTNGAWGWMHEGERYPKLRDLPLPADHRERAWVGGKERPVVNYTDLRAGDATFHTGGTMHAAAANATMKNRPAMVVCHMAPGTRMAEDPPEIQRTIFAPATPGDVLDGPKHPLLGTASAPSSDQPRHLATDAARVAHTSGNENSD